MSSFPFYRKNQSKVFPWSVRRVQGTYFLHFRQRPMSDTYAAAAAWLPTWEKSILNWKLKVTRHITLASLSRRHVTLGIV